MRSSWLYLAMRSVREAEPVLIWPAAVATARSAMKVSSVSPERCEMIELYPALRAQFDRVDGFGHAADLVELDQDGVGDAFVDAARETFRVGDEKIVADQLDLSSRSLLPRSVSVFQPAQSSSAMPSSIETIGYFSIQSVQIRGHFAGGALDLVRFLEDVFAAGLVVKFAGGRIERDGHLFAGFVSGGGDRLEHDLNGFFVGLADSARIRLRRRRQWSSHASSATALSE